MKRPLLVFTIVGTLLLLLLLTLAAKAKHAYVAKNDDEQSQSKVTKKSAKLGAYLLTQFFSEDYGDQAGGFSLSRNGHIDYSYDYHTNENTIGSFSQFCFVNPDVLKKDQDLEENECSNEAPFIAKDINHDGVPVLVVSGSTGGNGIGNTITIMIQLGKSGAKQIYLGDPCLFKKQSDGQYKITSTVLYDDAGGDRGKAVWIDVPLIWNGRLI